MDRTEDCFSHFESEGKAENVDTKSKEDDNSEERDSIITLVFIAQALHKQQFQRKKKARVTSNTDKSLVITCNQYAIK